MCPERIQKRIKTKYLDEVYDSFEEAFKRALEAKEKGEAVSIAVAANASDFFTGLTNKVLLLTSSLIKLPLMTLLMVMFQMECLYLKPKA